ncbi:CDP-alcohol phosphatidyltransferase family protein [Blattabacterium cuenoti]|uniref:CDP-alcohol phosphatidyltransferase family protein n=1 Tax=Blattabacterium cuenoti TaxID=1653831 RepID=UPI00293BCA99|nr:CDP-alcohol phosphatidyltransferase family protein [Blattabacterium cuenoti]
MIMKKIIHWLPNIITLLNLFFGCISIILLQKQYCIESFMFNLFSIFFDYIDGLLSRFIKNENQFGKELDSMADLISFGFYPSIIVFMLFQTNTMYAWCAFLILICSSLRLARCNLYQNKYNYGLKTPINALFFSSLYVIIFMSNNNTGFMNKVIILSNIQILIMIFLSCYLLISKIHMFSLKFKGKSWKKNNGRYIFIFISIIFLLTLHLIAIPCMILLYIIYSIFYQFYPKKIHYKENTDLCN